MQVLPAAVTAPKAATASMVSNGLVTQGVTVQRLAFSSALSVMWDNIRVLPGWMVAQCAWMAPMLLVKAQLAAWTVLRETPVVEVR
jgi:hypothetical protein